MYVCVCVCVCVCCVRVRACVSQGSLWLFKHVIHGILMKYEKQIDTTFDEIKDEVGFMRRDHVYTWGWLMRMYCHCPWTPYDDSVLSGCVSSWEMKDCVCVSVHFYI